MEGPKSCCKAPVRCCIQPRLYQHCTQPCTWLVGTVQCKAKLGRAAGALHGAPILVLAIHPPAAVCYSAARPGSESRRDGQEIVKQVASNGPHWPSRSQTPVSPSGVGTVAITSHQLQVRLEEHQAELRTRCSKG